MKISPFVPYTLRDKANVPLSGAALQEFARFVFEYAKEEAAKAPEVLAKLEEFSKQKALVKFAECSEGIVLAGKMALFRGMEKFFKSNPDGLQAEHIFNIAGSTRLNKQEIAIVKKSLSNPELAKSGYDANARMREFAKISAYPIINKFFALLARQEGVENSYLFERLVADYTSSSNFLAGSLITGMRATPKAPVPLKADAAHNVLAALKAKTDNPSAENIYAFEVERLKLVYMVAKSIGNNADIVANYAFEMTFRAQANFAITSLPQEVNKPKPIVYDIDVTKFANTVEAVFRNALKKADYVKFSKAYREALQKSAQALGLENLQITTTNSRAV